MVFRGGDFFKQKLIFVFNLGPYLEVSLVGIHVYPYQSACLHKLSIPPKFLQTYNIYSQVLALVIRLSTSSNGFLEI